MPGNKLFRLNKLTAKAGIIYVFLLPMFGARFIVSFLVIVLIEIYFLQAVKIFSQDFSPNRRNFFIYFTYALGIVNLVLGMIAIFYPPPNWNDAVRMVFSISLILFVCKALSCSFLLIDDIIRVGKMIYLSLISRAETIPALPAGISRSKFISQVAVGFASIAGLSFIYGMMRGAYKYRVHNVKVPSPNLPAAFDGYKIVQISDIHTGSFLNNSALTKAFDIVMQQNADVILFTGDLVNNKAEETIGFEEVYKKLKAPHGVYSVLGNHDYGDYVLEYQEDPEAKRKNLEDLKKIQESVGWRLLMNEHVALERNGEKIALIGIENWGGSLRFPKYGKMDLAHKGTEEYPFKILMSHDPSHWEKQVQTEYKNVDLTLSGHTHGFQFGIEIPGFQWSPVKYFYKQWAGLYKKDNQFLYVNRGLGFLGYPGRLGIWPEITVLELQKV